MLFIKKQKTIDPWTKNSFIPSQKIQIQSTVTPAFFYSSFNEWANYIHLLNTKIKYNK